MQYLELVREVTAIHEALLPVNENVESTIVA
jgi:hypothetical protein